MGFWGLRSLGWTVKDGGLEPCLRQGEGWGSGANRPDLAREGWSFGALPAGPASGRSQRMPVKAVCLIGERGEREEEGALWDWSTSCPQSSPWGAIDCFTPPSTSPSPPSPPPLPHLPARLLFFSMRALPLCCPRCCLICARPCASPDCPPPPPHCMTSLPARCLAAASCPLAHPAACPYCLTRFLPAGSPCRLPLLPHPHPARGFSHTGPRVLR